MGFVVGTGVCPPASLEAAGQTAQAPITFSSPLSLRHMIATLISAIKQLERCTKRTIVPPRRKKVFSLRSLGYREPRIGFSARLNFADSDIIGPLLFQVLIEDSFQPMIEYLRQRERPLLVDAELQNTRSRLSRTERAKMGRSLRG